MGLLGNLDDGQKPLCRKYFAALKKSGVKTDKIKDIVEKIKLSGSGEWIIIEAENCVALMHADSKVGSYFWETINTFSGKLKALELIPAKGKLGFDLQPSETLSGEWEVDESEEEVTFSTEGVKKPIGGIGIISLKTMQVTSPSVKTDSKNTKEK